MTGRFLTFGFATLMSFVAVPGRAEAQTPDAQPRTTFRSAVDVVSVTAVVRDRKGRFVANLDRQDFIVADGGEQRPLVDFHAESDGPVKLAILVDISGSMRLGSKAVDSRQAAQHLFSALRPTDEAAIFTFDTRLQRVTDFTSDVPALTAALDHVEPPYGQTSMFDAVADTARAVAAAGTGAGDIPQRSAVVVLTDGIDTRSRMTAEQVSSISSGIDVPVYILAVMSSIDDPRQAGAAKLDVAGSLQDLAHVTGGELFTASAPAHASVAARQIIEELRHQYRLAFEASPHPGWRPLEVRARGRDLIVRARAGYTVGGTSGLLTFEKVHGGALSHRDAATDVSGKRINASVTSWRTR
jgi:VWFA-related protein